MARVAFTSNLQRHLNCPELDVAGTTLKEVMDAAFNQNPSLQSYILDDQGAIRKHVAVFINNKPVKDPRHLSDPVDESGEVFVMQALSGG